MHKLTALVIAALIGAFVVNGLFPFAVPLSMLVYYEHPWAYHAALFAILANFMCLALAVSISRRHSKPLIRLLCYFCSSLLILLLFFDKPSSQSHTVAATLFYITAALLGLIVTNRLPHHSFKILASVPLTTLPFLFSSRILYQGISEGILVLTSLLIFNTLPSKSRFYFAAHRFVSSPTIEAGKPAFATTWSIACVLPLMLLNSYNHSEIWAVLHVATCWFSAFFISVFRGSAAASTCALSMSTQIAGESRLS